MSDVVRTMVIGYNTVQVEVDPDEFKKPAVAWIFWAFAGLFLIANGYALAGWPCLLMAPVALFTHRLAWQGRVDLAVREAAYQGVYKYEDSRLLAYKSLG